jgi:hypothetical protein
MVTHEARLASWRIGLVRYTFNRLRVDFALYHFGTNKVVAVVELDDRSHASREQKDEDARRDRILLAAGIKVVRLQYGQETTPQALAERFAGFIPFAVGTVITDRPPHRSVRAGFPHKMWCATFDA